MKGTVAEHNDDLASTSCQESWLKKYFAETGVPFVSTDERLWYSTGSKIFVNLPCSGPTQVGATEKKVLWRSGAVFLKYPVPPEMPGFPSYLYIVSDKRYGLETLARSVRKETVRALKKCHVERIPIQEILQVAPEIIADTHIRQGRQFNDKILKEWMQSIVAAVENPIFECWAAFVGSRVGAFRIDFTYSGGFYGDVLFNVKDLLKYQVMNALMFVSTEKVMQRPNIEHVSYGLRSIYGDKPSLNRFKESMGYQKIPLSEMIEVAPKYSGIITRETAAMGASILGKLNFRSQKIQKLEAILDMFSHQHSPDV